MDILHPTALVHPHHEVATHGQAAIDEAEKTLSDFKKFSKELTAEADDLHAAAKDLVREVQFNVEQGKVKVEQGEWSVSDLDQSRKNLVAKQEPVWNKLQAKADALKAKLEGPYKLVVAVNQNILRARGDTVTGGLLGALTPDQKEVRKVYDNKLKVGFDDAAAAHAALTSYPDGVLIQIPLLHKKSLGMLGNGKEMK